MPVSHDPVCPACGERVEPDDTHCGACGAALVQQATTPRERRRPRRPARRRSTSPATEVVGALAPHRPISRWWPESTAGRVGLGLFVIAAVAVTLVVDDDERILVVLVAGVGLILYLVWRNILISWGLMGANRGEAPAPRGQVLLPERPRRSGAAWKVGGVVILLAALAGARACGRLLGDWLF